MVKTAEALARLAGVASALGDSSRYLWLKLPYCEDYRAAWRDPRRCRFCCWAENRRAMPRRFLNNFAAALAAGSNVRGALVGRNVLYPGRARIRSP